MPRPKGSSLTANDILIAAIAVIQQEGEAALGINRVARQLSIKPPSMYNHIPSNEALYRLVALEAWRRLLAVTEKNLLGITGSQETLRSAAYSYREFAQSNPELMAIAAQHAMSLADEEFAIVHGKLVGIYQRALEPWNLSPAEVIHAVRMLNAMFFGYAQLERNKIFRYPESMEESYQWMVERAIDSLKNGQP